MLKEQPEKEKEKETRPGVSLLSYRPFFRELDMEVLSVLQCGLLSCSLMDSELHTKVGKIIHFAFTSYFNLLLISYASLCINMNTLEVIHLQYSLVTEVREEVLLGPAEMVFLLDDMLRKLEFSLTAASTKRAPFLKVQKTADAYSDEHGSQNA